MHAVLEESVKPEETAKPGSVCRDGSFLFTYHVAIFLVSYYFVNILKLGTPKIITVIFLQMEQFGFCNFNNTFKICRQKANSIDPEQTVPLGV